MNNALHGYNLHLQPSRSAAGGFALYTNKSLNAVKRTDLSVTVEEFETVWVEIKNIKSKSILCCCAYRHPSSFPERFTEHIETILHNLARENKNIFILGDFNIELLNCENHPASENFLNMMNSNCLLSYILQPTLVTDRSATLIDNIFANTFNFNALSGNLVTKISDHFPQFLIIEDLKVYQWSCRPLPPCFSEYFKFTSSFHSYSTRQSCNRNLHVTSVNTTQLAYPP